MSDPVTNVEIEDVLSSIRRLVSEDARPRQAAPKPAPDRLVLTPSQRVTEQEPWPVTSSSADADADAAEAQEPILLTEFASEPEAEPDLDDGAGQAPDATAGDAAADASAIADAGEKDTADDAGPSDAPELEGALDDSALTQDDVLSRMVEQEVVNALHRFSARADAAEEPAAPEPGKTDDRPDPAAPDETAMAPDQTRPASLEQKVTQLEALIAGTPGDWEGEEPATDANAAFLQEAGGALPWQDYDPETEDEAETAEATEAPVADEADRAGPAAQDDTPPEPEDADAPDIDAPDIDAPGDAEGTAQADTAWQTSGAQQGERAEAEAASAFSVDDAPLIDEDMLRDMVAEIVRQELQGALGERITRNVRKLVRREIHRALLSQQLE